MKEKQIINIWIEHSIFFLLEVNYSYPFFSQTEILLINSAFRVFTTPGDKEEFFLLWLHHWLIWHKPARKRKKKKPLNLELITDFRYLAMIESPSARPVILHFSKTRLFFPITHKNFSLSWRINALCIYVQNGNWSSSG